MRVTLEEAAQLLKTQVVAIPTETVYGLAASISSPDAINRIFSLKGRPRKNPLIIHLFSPDDIESYVESLPPSYDKLATLWPGPLTLILDVKVETIPSTVRANLRTAAFRIPALPLARDLLALTGPLVVPSANLSGRPSSTEASHVEQDFGLAFPVLDGGVCQNGLESTILSFSEGKWVVLRQGALPPEIFIPILGYAPVINVPKDPLNPECPGQLYKHYSPKARLSALEGEVVVGFTERSYPKPVINLGSLERPEEVAHHLYDALRKIDEQGYNTAQVDLNFPETGLWSTIRERLTKAMQP